MAGEWRTVWASGDPRIVINGWGVEDCVGEWGPRIVMAGQSSIYVTCTTQSSSAHSVLIHSCIGRQQTYIEADGQTIDLCGR